MDTFHYSYTVPFTYGGPAGNYDIQVPFDSDCEACVLAATFRTGGQLTIVSGSSAYIDSSLINGLATSAGGVPALHYESAAQATITGLDSWFPVSRRLAMTTSAVAYVTLQYRRKLSAPIFEKWGDD